jgi:myo-inositol 2-dehydrogenase/D-chiro-inositol 1-dehydrogenase
MLDIAVLGAGRIGRIHAGNIVAHPGARLVGISDTDADSATRLTASLGTSPISVAEAMRADAVLIASPTPTRADYVEQAAVAGRAVFCEKPIDLSEERVRRCLAAVRAAGVVLMTGFNRRFDPHFASLKQRLDEGEIGRLELLTIISRDPSPPPLSYITSSGGLFRDMMIHDLDMARFLLGEEPVAVSATASCLIDPAIGETGDVDTALVMLRTASGRLCQISNSRRATYGYDQRIEAHGADGLLQVGNVVPTTVQVATASGFRSDPALPFFLERYAAAYRAELDAFVKAARGEGPDRPDGEDGLRALLLANAAVEAAKSGRTVRPAEV